MLLFSLPTDSTGGQSKLERIYVLYNRVMYGAAYKVLHNQEDALDVVQDALIKIGETMSSMGDLESPKTRNYVITVTVNKAIDLYRANQRKKKVVYRAEIWNGATEKYYFGELAACLDKLSPRYRLVIMLKYCHGLSIKEIGARLKITEANANKLVQRAKNKLYQYCREEGIL